MVFFVSGGIVVQTPEDHSAFLPAGAITWDGDEQFCAGMCNHTVVQIVFEELGLIQA